MAFPEDTNYFPAGPKAVRRSSITELESSTLFALILQIGGGVLALYYALPSVILAPFLSGVFPWIVSQSSYYGFLVVWALLSIMAVLQIYLGYKLYKMVPDTISRAIRIDVVVIILYGIDAFISAYENILIAYPTVLIYLAANVLLVYLLNLQSVRNELGGSEKLESEYQSYSG